MLQVEYLEKKLELVAYDTGANPKKKLLHLLKD